MLEFILANLLFHAVAGATLMLVASGSAALDLRARRAVRTYVAASPDGGVVLDLPAAPRAPKLIARVEEEAHSEAA